MRLDQIVDALEHPSVSGPLDRTVSSVTHDSRRAGRDDVFVAIPGAVVDGRRFVPGLQVAAVIAEGPVNAEPGVTVIQVPSARAALADAAAVVSGRPATALPVVGITGTNGKTTTTWLLEGIAQAAGWPVGILGTAGHHIAGAPVATERTTPEAPVVQGLLARARDAGCRFVAMEVSSHGVALERVRAIPFQVVAFTSWGRDHLDFHGTPEAYFAAKARLFTELVDPTGAAVLNAEHPDIAALSPRTATTWRVRLSEPADLWIEGLRLGLDGAEGQVHTPCGSGPFRLQLLGAHNVENALCALGCALALGVSLDEALAGLAGQRAVRGRLEAVPNGHGLHVLVDYAHTPDALERVLATLRTLGAGRILTVVGCGGDRDKGKRPLMGQAADVGSDCVYATSDNPRSEDPGQILAELVAGVAGEHRAIVDRAEAIATAIQDATPSDIVLIAGKGHERTQEIAGVRHPFDDAEVAAAALARRTP